MHLTNDQRRGRRRRVGDGQRLAGQALRALVLRRVAVMELQDGIPGADLVADLRHDHDADGGIDRIFDTVAAGAEHNRRPSNQFGVEACDISALWRGHDHSRRRLRQAIVIVDHTWIAALLLDDATEAFEACTRRDRLARLSLARRAIGRHASSRQHPRGQLDRNLDQIARAAALQHVEAFDDLEGIAHGAAERLLHRGNHGLGPHARRVADRDERFGEPPRVGLGLHERAAAGLDVEDERVDALRDLLAHDRRADERNALDRRRHVTKCVELLVRRRNLRRLADHRAAHRAERVPHFFQRKRELVERPAGVAEAAARHHRYRDAAGRRERRKNERRLVADAARAVLVDLDARYRGEIDAGA